MLHWQDLFFSAALDLLQQYEREWNTAEIVVRESIQIRLEYLIAVPQQVLPFVSINSTVPNEKLGNTSFAFKKENDAQKGVRRK